jgi:ribonuclease HI
MPKIISYYYAVLIGRTPGVYKTWEECKEQVNSYPLAYYKKCLSLETAFAIFNEFQLKFKQKNEILSNDSDKIIIFTDGSYKDNKKGSYAGIGIYHDDGTKKIAEPLPGLLQSNNRAELYAVIRAIETCENQDKVIEIRTDSRYVINAYELWINEWKKRNWKTVRNKLVKNKDLFEKLDSLINKRLGKVYFTHVFSHSNVIENNLADKLAKKGAAINMNEQKKLSPYNSFMKFNLPIIKKNNPELDHKTAFKLVASMWKDSINNPKNDFTKYL